MRSFLFNIWFYAGTAAVAFAGYLLTLGAGPVTFRRLLHFWTRLVLFGLRRILGARVELLGRENLPQGGRPALIISKHQSELDAILLLNQFPDLGAIAMQELENYPFIGRIVGNLGYILVPVEGPRAGKTQAVIEGALRVHAEGRPVLIYPEGTLMELGARERYRSGAWHIYNALGCAAQPVAQSVGVIWPRREWYKRAFVRGGLEFLPEIPPGLDQTEFMERLEQTIETATMNLVHKHAPPDLAAWAQARWERGEANGDA